MCANYVPVTDRDELLASCGVQRDFAHEVPPELHPTDLAPFIRLASGGRVAEPGRFGLPLLTRGRSVILDSEHAQMLGPPGSLASTQGKLPSGGLRARAVHYGMRRLPLGRSEHFDQSLSHLDRTPARQAAPVKG